MSKKYACHKISEGKAEAEIILSKEHMCFYRVYPESGIVMEKGHDLEGRSVAKKVMSFVGGKGSSVVQADGLFQLNMHENMPAAMIIKEPEGVLVSAAIVMEIPMVDRVEPEFYDVVKDGDRVLVNADEGFVEILD